MTIAEMADSMQSTEAPAEAVQSKRRATVDERTLQQAVEQQRGAAFACLVRLASGGQESGGALQERLVSMEARDLQQLARCAQRVSGELLFRQNCTMRSGITLPDLDALKERIEEELRQRLTVAEPLRPERGAPPARRGSFVTRAWRSVVAMARRG